MFHTCSAIVLHLTPHTDKTTLVHLYTQQHGKVCAAISGLHGRRSGAKIALFSPLTPLQVTLQGKDGQWRIQEASINNSYSSIATHHGKRSIAFFIAELLMHCLQENDADEDLFTFLHHSVETLETSAFCPDFHLHLMIQLTSYLGIYPNIETDGDIFDLENGIRRHVRPTHPHFLSPEETRAFCTLCQASPVEALSLNRKERQQLVENLLTYYRLHIPYFGQLRSLAILQEVFD